MNEPPVITLLTDFGLRDPYVGIMKGVVLSRCPSARLVDLTHQLDQGDVNAAGYLLASAWPYFPEAAVHTAVVDPGVGTERRILAAETGGQRFVAPDNGLLSAVLDHAAETKVVSVENRDLFVEPVSDTFHGRDIFAPTAAALASGRSLEELGPATTSWVHIPRLHPAEDSAGAWVGQVVYVDGFGNLVTNLTAEQVGPRDRVEASGYGIHGLQRSYAAVDAGAPLAIIGSTGRLEISINGGSAATAMGLGVGDTVRVWPAPNTAERAP